MSAAAARERNPLFTPSVILLTAMSLSIGWGIRGNFGHESGAMIPGALAAIVVAACSRREDWQSRIPHAALLGGLGYGFGGSISYMYPISYTHSGHFDTMVYGFLTTFLEGGLWCALGVAGAALALTAPRDRLARIYPPLLFVLAALFIKQFGEDWLDGWLSPGDLGSDTWHRQKAPLYWFDADWFAALTAFAGVCAYDLWSRASERARWSPFFVFFGGVAGEAAYLAWHRSFSHGPDVILWIFIGALVGLAIHNVFKRDFSHLWLVLLFMSVGAGFGWLVQLGLDKGHWLQPLLDAVVVPQGDLNYIDPTTGKPFPVEELMNNWPQFFSDYPQHVGWLIGAVLGFMFYFAVFGEWKNDSGLFAAMSLGWLIGFLVMPVSGQFLLAGDLRWVIYAVVAVAILAAIQFFVRRITNRWVRAGVNVGVSLVALGLATAGWKITASLMPDPIALWPGIADIGGFRMTPPRSDDWAGIVGVFLGALFWTYRRDHRLVTLALSLGFFFGGFGFTTAHLLRTLARIPGHPSLNTGEVSDFLKHYQSANWHSVMEQSQGFCLGIATVLALAFIWRRDPACTSGAKMPGWTTNFAVLFALFGFTFMNLYKVVWDWIDKGHAVMPKYMKAPLLEFINIHALAWFNIAWWAAALAAFALCLRNRRHPLAFLPANDAGRGQLLWFAVVWIMVLGNFSRALPGFNEQRLITEWVIFINACIATALIGVPNVSPLAAFAARRQDVVETLATGRRDAERLGRAPEFLEADTIPVVRPDDLDERMEVAPTLVERASRLAGVSAESETKASLRDRDTVDEATDLAGGYRPRWGFVKLLAIWVVGLGLAIPAMYGYAKTVDYVYQGKNVEDLEHAHRRFGPDAIWRTKPILKHGEHR